MTASTLSIREAKTALPAETPSDIKEAPFGETFAPTGDTDFERDNAQGRDLFTYEQGRKILRKIDWHLMPCLLITYILRGLDSGAVSYVKTMNPKSPTNIMTQLHMTTNQYAYLSTVFTVFYALGEVPSNMLFKRTTPRWHYIRIVVLWSIVAACHAAAKNYAGILVVRGFLGLFEAGMAPAAYLHLTYWYRPDEVGWRYAMISSMFNFCNIFTALLAYGFSAVDGHGGLGGWQWMYIACGLFGIALVAIIWFFMPGFPDTASWLTEDERQWVLARLGPGSSRSTDSNFDIAAFKAACFDIKNVAFATMIMLFNTGALGLSYWLPTIISSFGLTKNAGESLLLNIPPAFLYWIGGVGGAWLNDRLTMVPRPFIVWGALSYKATGLFLLAYIRNRKAQYAIICTMYPLASWAYQSFIPWRVQSLRGSTDAAFVMAFLTGAGQLSGLWSAQIYKSKYAPNYTIPFVICACLIIGAMLVGGICWYLTFDSERETRRIQKARRKAGKQDNAVLHEDVDFDAAKAARKQG